MFEYWFIVLPAIAIGCWAAAMIRFQYLEWKDRKSLRQCQKAHKKPTCNMTGCDLNIKYKCYGTWTQHGKAYQPPKNCLVTQKRILFYKGGI